MRAVIQSAQILIFGLMTNTKSYRNLSTSDNVDYSWMKVV